MKSVDTHAHVFKRGLKLADVRRYAPGYDVLVDDYLRELDAHAISHGVLVQPSFLGTDNSFMVDALRRHPQRLRGIAMVDPDVSAAELDELADGGVVGIRLNLVGGAAIPDFEVEPWPALLRNLAQREWQVEVHREARDLPMIVGRLLDAGVNVVVDHMGRPDATLGVDDPGFQYLLCVAESQAHMGQAVGRVSLECPDRGCCGATPAPRVRSRTAGVGQRLAAYPVREDCPVRADARGARCVGA